MLPNEEILSGPEEEAVSGKEVGGKGAHLIYLWTR